MSSGQLYKPFLSDSEYESEYDSDSSQGEGSVINDGYTTESSLCSLPGRNPPVEGGTAPLGFTTEPAKGTKFETGESRNTSLFTINSRDRDTRVYPQPTFFTIRLPKVMKNVRQINISQITLLNSFFNFDVAKGNTFMYVLESGRTITSNASTIDNAIRINIRNGTYSANDLVTELGNALNTTPLFADITYGDFATSFRTTGNFGLLFNTPGKIVYNSLTQSYDANQTINNIIARYFQVVQNSGTVNYSDDQVLVAYYYPIIKEMIVAQPSPLPFSVVGQDVPPGFSNWYDYLVFAFQGLNDPYVLKICQDPANIIIFNNYRAQNTFNQFLVNKYVCSYNAKQGRLVISAPSLNDSIVADLNSAYSNFLSALVIQSNFQNTADFYNQYNAALNRTGALTDYYNFIQKNFATNFGVTFGKYAENYYANFSNEIQIYDITDKYGWSITPQAVQLQISSMIPATQISTLWSNITLPIADPANSSFIQEYTVSTFGTSNLLQFSNAGEATYGYTDAVFDINPTSYIRTNFTSRCRQSISLMTIPRYLSNRNPGTEIVYDFSPSTTPFLFNVVDASTTFIRCDVTNNLLFNMYQIDQNMFNTEDYMRTNNEWLNYIYPRYLSGVRVQESDPAYNSHPPINNVTMTSFRPFVFFQMNADEYPVDPTAHFEVDFFLETQDGSPFPVPVKVSWYKDRAAFMADSEQEVNGNIGYENARNYFKQQIYSNTSTAMMTVDVNNKQQTYFHINLLNASNLPASIPLRAFALLKNQYGIYRPSTYYDTLDMPWQNLPPLADQFTPASDIYIDPLKSIYNQFITQIGYDISGVSNNLLDYFINAGNSNFYDPENITDYTNGTLTGLRYLFVRASDGSPTPNPNIVYPWSLYFATGSSNVIRDTYNTSTNVYLKGGQTPKRLPAGQTNEHLLINWLNFNSAVSEEFMQPCPTNSIYSKVSTSSVFLPCINDTSPLITDMSTNYSFTDLSGFAGISFFLPPNDVVKLDSLLVKFAYTQPSFTSNNTLLSRVSSSLVYSGLQLNSNFYYNQTTPVQTSNSPLDDWDDWYLYNRRNIKVGVFRSADISGANVSTLSLSTALLTLTLNKVTQVNNFQSQAGTRRTRSPDWGTYYSYKLESNSKTIWDVTNTTYTSTVNASTFWRSTVVGPDIVPTYYAGENSTYGYFFTVNGINNYSYLSRTYGIAPSVGNAVDYPYAGTPDYLSDIPNSFTAVPFYYDAVASTYKVGSFWGVSYTHAPQLPSFSTLGAAPYYGPAGIYGWEATNSTFILKNGDQPTYKPYYWNTKVKFESLNQDYNPATDLSMFGGYPGISGELQDTVLFFYKNTNEGDDYKDISTIVGGTAYYRWGQESSNNYVAWDDQGGYNFLSYIHDVDVRPGTEYATHVRAYDPIPRFTTGLRFIGKNYTDFGRPTFTDIMFEISTLNGYVPITSVQANSFLTNPTAYISTINRNNEIREASFMSHHYADSLINFDILFSTTKSFGRTASYVGAPFTLTGYSNAMVQFSTFRSTAQASYSIFTDILSTATGQLNEYVLVRYGSILPSSIITRNRITDPLAFQFLFKSKTPMPYAALPDEWGLGWNLGFAKVDTVPRTTITSDTFIRITQDYVYLRLNPEFNINTFGTGGKENLAETRESRGQDMRYFSKILLSDFGGFSRSAVQLPKVFNPVLGKYETVSCQLVDKFGTQLVNTDCEYDFTLEISEISQGPKDTSSLILPSTAPVNEIINNQGRRPVVKKKKAAESPASSRASSRSPSPPPAKKKVVVPRAPKK